MFFAEEGDEDVAEPTVGSPDAVVVAAHARDSDDDSDDDNLMIIDTRDDQMDKIVYFER
jgi:hypothetical protein